MRVLILIVEINQVFKEFFYLCRKLNKGNMKYWPILSKGRFMKVLIYFPLFIMHYSLLFAQPENVNAKLARINDPDGYTYLRKGPAKTYAIKDTIRKNIFFYCAVNDSDWYKIYDMYGNYMDGYIYRNKVQIIDMLSNKEKRKLIQAGFAGMRKMDSLRESFYDTNNHLKVSVTTFNQFDQQWRTYVDIQYHPAMFVFDSYFEKTGDTLMLKDFLSVCCGDADELPGYTLASCFASHPTVVTNELRRDDTSSIKGYFGVIDFGLQNIYYPPSEGANAQDLDKAEAKLSKAYETLLGRKRIPKEE